MKWFIALWWVVMNMMNANPVQAAATTLPTGFATKSFKTTDKTELVYYESAPASADALTVVMIPGWTMPGWIYFEQAKLLAPQARVVVLDPRGQGASKVSADGYNYARRARDISELLAACQCNKTVLMGWSLGGLEALQYSVDFTNTSLEGLVLVDHSVGTGTPPKWDPTFLPRVRKEQRKAMSGFVNGMFKSKPDPAWVAALTEASLKLPADLSVSLLSQPTPREFWRDAFLNTPVPILYSVVPRFREQATIMQQAKPSIRVSIYEGAGHALFIDESKRFAAELVAFIQDLPDLKLRRGAK